MRLSLLQKMVVMRVISFIALLLLVAAVLLMGRQIQGVRRGLIQERINMEKSLVDAVHQIALQEQLDNNRVRLAEIERMVPSMDNIGVVVSRIEKEARKREVTVRIPRIQEKHEFDENGDLIEPTGQLRDVQMQIEADGSPVKLIYFMHDVEYIPFLLNIVSFDFKLDSGTANTSGATIGLGNLPPGSEGNVKSTKKSHLKMGIVLTTRVTESE